MTEVSVTDDFGDYLYWKEEISDLDEEDLEEINGSPQNIEKPQRTSKSEAQRQRRLFIQQYARMGASPYVRLTPEYRPMKRTFAQYLGNNGEATPKETDERTTPKITISLASDISNTIYESGVYGYRPISWGPRFKSVSPGGSPNRRHLSPLQVAHGASRKKSSPNPATFHHRLVSTLFRKLHHEDEAPEPRLQRTPAFRRKKNSPRLKMGNRSSNASGQTPSSDKKQAKGNSAEKNAVQVKPPSDPTTTQKDVPNTSKGLVLSDSGESLVDSCSGSCFGSPQFEAPLPELRIENVSSADSSSVSSSMFVDTSEKFYSNSEDAADVSSDVFERESLVFVSPDSDITPVMKEAPILSDVTPTVENVNDKKDVIIEDNDRGYEEDDEDDDNDISYHDTHEDASSCDTDSSPQKRAPRCIPSRSCPGTPDTHLDGPFGSYPIHRSHRYGSVGNVHSSRRKSLSPIGSTNRLDFSGSVTEGSEDDDDGLKDDHLFRSTTSLVVPKYRVTPQQHSPSPRFRTPTTPGAARRELCNSELCLRVNTLTVPQVLRRYCSQNFSTPQPECCGSVLKRVASLTLDKATLEKKISRPKFVPEKLDFSLYEKFEGQMLVNWFCSTFPGESSLSAPFSRLDMKIIAAQFCTNLLAAGVLKQIEDDSVPKESLFRPDLMYFWSKNEPSSPVSNYTTPSKLSPAAWPPTPHLPSERKLHRSCSEEFRSILTDTKNERFFSTERLQREQEKGSTISLLQPLKRINEYEDKVARLELQVEKYQTLAGIESLTRKAKYVSCPTSPHDSTAPSTYIKSSYVQTEPPRPMLNSSTQWDLSTTMACRYVQTESALRFSTGVQTNSGLRQTAHVQTDDWPDVIRGLPDGQCCRSVSFSLGLSSFDNDKVPKYSLPKSKSWLGNDIPPSSVSTYKVCMTASKLPPPVPEDYISPSSSVDCVSSQQQHLTNSVIDNSRFQEENKFPFHFDKNLSAAMNSVTISENQISLPSPLPTYCISCLSRNNIQPSLESFTNIPQPPPLPGSNIPPPPPLPGSNIPPPPPFPGSNIPPPPPLPGSYIPPPPPFPGNNIPLPPPMPGSSIPPPPPMPGSNIPPPPPLPGSNIPPPPPMPGSNIPPPPPLPGSNIPPPPPMPGSNIPPPPPLPGSNIPPPPPMPGSNIPPPPPLPGSNIPPPLPGSVPLPPPLPGSTGPPPPPPLPGSSVPPPPPPPGGSIPPPPPLFSFGAPAPFFNNSYNMQSQIVVRKPAVKPKQPMRPLYWNRIQIKTFPTAAPDENCLWENLDETPLEAWDEFEELFSKQITKKKDPPANKTKQSKTKEVAKLLDQKRSQNVGILISSLHLDIAEIENALYSFDTSVIDTDTLQAIYDVRPTEDELQTIKCHLSSNTTVPLDKPEQFLYDLSLIPEYANRIECIMFHSSFAENIGSIENKLNNLKMTCNFLIGQQVHKVLGIILALGNYMNGGNMSRGQADGFGLEILPKLKDVKSKDNSLTLLHYVVQVYVKIYEKDVPADASQLPLPEPGDIDRAGNVNFDDVSKDLKKLEIQIRSCERKVEKILNTSDNERQQPLKDMMETFLKKALKEHRLQAENLDTCRLKFLQTQSFFRYQPKAQSDSEWPKEFFSLWASFCQDFKDIWKKELQKKIKQEIEKSRKRVNEIKAEKKANIVKVKSKSSGLKAKLSKIVKHNTHEVEVH